MDDVHQSILSLDNSLKLLSQHYDSTTSNEIKLLHEQINNFEKRWTQLIDDLKQISTRVNIFFHCFLIKISFSLSILV